MTLGRLNALQWIGLITGAAAWSIQEVAGYALTEAECGPGDAPWGVQNDTWQVSFMIVAILLLVAAEAASITVLLRTRGTTYELEPPLGRIRFFAITAVVANALFLVAVPLSGVASMAATVCRQA
jgi:hypothetical protein